ncbi:MAG: asparagine synthase C-terminal domain-containing protein [Candidatus Hodarchaeales archaeon]
MTENTDVGPILESLVQTKGLQVISIALKQTDFSNKMENVYLKSDFETKKMDMLKSILTEVVVLNSKAGSIGLLFSGGLDSSVLAQILVNHVDKEKLKFVTVGRLGSPDLTNAEEGASSLGVNLHLERITKDNFEVSIRELKKLKTVRNLGDLTVAIPLYLGMKYLARADHVNTIFLGQGADEIFGGYYKYKLLLKQGGEREVIKKMEEDLRQLKQHQMLMESEIANRFGVKLVYPYLEYNVIDLAKSLPFELYFKNESEDKVVRKVFLRKFAKYINLADHIVNKEKKAMQYGSGTVKLLRSYASNRGYRNVRDWFCSEFRTNFP